MTGTQTARKGQEAFVPVEVLPFTRVLWKTEDRGLRALVREIGREYVRAELETVSQGLRPCATVHVYSENAWKEVRALGERGLVFVPILEVRRVHGFAHRFYKPRPGEPYDIYGVVAKKAEDALEFAEASRRGDHRKLGELLGYPECCVKFFEEKWVRERHVDPPWAIAVNTPGAEANGDEVAVRGFPECNVMIRYASVRVVPHLPCSFTCEETVEFAKMFLRFMPHGKEALKLLSRPLVWDCWRGVVVVDHPDFMIVANSTPYARRKRVRWLGGKPTGP